jgi:hypothetical protein
LNLLYAKYQQNLGKVTVPCNDTDHRNLHDDFSFDELENSEVYPLSPMPALYDAFDAEEDIPVFMVESQPEYMEIPALEEEHVDNLAAFTSVSHKKTASANLQEKIAALGWNNRSINVTKEVNVTESQDAQIINEETKSSKLEDNVSSFDAGFVSRLNNVATKSRNSTSLQDKINALGWNKEIPQTPNQTVDVGTLMAKLATLGWNKHRNNGTQVLNMTQEAIEALFEILAQTHSLPEDIEKN